jgi:hypothetical protein
LDEMARQKYVRLDHLHLDDLDYRSTEDLGKMKAEGKTLPDDEESDRSSKKSSAENDADDEARSS